MGLALSRIKERGKWAKWPVNYTFHVRVTNQYSKSIIDILLTLMPLDSKLNHVVIKKVFIIDKNPTKACHMNSKPRLSRTKTSQSGEIQTLLDATQSNIWELVPQEDPRLPIENSTKASGKPAKTPKKDHTRDDSPMEEAIGQEDATKEKKSKKPLPLTDENMQGFVSKYTKEFGKLILQESELYITEPWDSVCSLILSFIERLSSYFRIDIKHFETDNMSLLLKVFEKFAVDVLKIPKRHVLKHFVLGLALPARQEHNMDLLKTYLAKVMKSTQYFSHRELNEVAFTPEVDIASISSTYFEEIESMLRICPKTGEEPNKTLFNRVLRENDFSLIMFRWFIEMYPPNSELHRRFYIKDTEECEHELLTLQCAECGTKTY